MKKRKNREYITPDLTPLIDVIFILLLFFMVSSVFKKEELALILNLPTSNSQMSLSGGKNIYIELNRRYIAFNGKKLDIKIFELKLKSIKDKGKSIVVRIDKDIKYHRFIKVFDLLSKYNLSNLSLITKKDK